MLFTSPNEKENEKATTSLKKIQILLSCQIALDQWTGEARLQPEINVNVSTAGRIIDDGTTERKVERETKKLFGELLNNEKMSTSKLEGQAAATTTGKVQPDAVIRAVSGVLGVVFGG